MKVWLFIPRQVYDETAPQFTAPGLEVECNGASGKSVAYRLQGSINKEYLEVVTFPDEYEAAFDRLLAESSTRYQELGRCSGSS